MKENKKLKKSFGKVTLILLIFFVGSYITIFQTSFVKAQEVNFPDKNLENAIREVIGKTSGESIYKEDLDCVHVLYLSHKNIMSIDGLEYFTYLNILDLNSNNISDVSPLSNLTILPSLTSLGTLILDLSDNNISDISPLSNLTWLVGLDLSSNNISDISPLSNLTNIRALNLRRNHIGDITQIKGMINIGEYESSPYLGLQIDLDLSYNEISDISPLIENPGINDGDSIDISNNPLNSKSIDFYILMLESKGAKVTWEPIKEKSATSSFPESKSFIYILVLAAITISIFAVYQITKKKPKKEVKEREFKEKITEERPKKAKIHKEEKIEPLKLKKLLKERDRLKNLLSRLKSRKEELMSEGMSEEKYNKMYNHAIEKLKTTEELISLIEEK